MDTDDRGASRVTSAAGGALAGVGLSAGWGTLVLAMLVGVAVTAALIVAFLYTMDPDPVLGSAAA